MMIHDGIFAWEGFGGIYRLAAGKCRLSILDLSRGEHRPVAHLKPMIVVVSDLSNDPPHLKSVSVRSCASHIATTVTQRFGIDPARMTYVEYYPPSSYGDHDQHLIQARFDAVDFTWIEGKALNPRWRTLPSSLRETVAEMIARRPQAAPA